MQACKYSIDSTIVVYKAIITYYTFCRHQTSPKRSSAAIAEQMSSVRENANTLKIITIYSFFLPMQDLVTIHALMIIKDGQQKYSNKVTFTKKCGCNTCIATYMKRPDLSVSGRIKSPASIHASAWPLNLKYCRIMCDTSNQYLFLLIS